MDAMNGTRIPRIALNLSKVVALLIIFAQHVVQAMTNNPWFPSLTALLITTTADLAALQAAEATALTRAKGAREARDDKKRVLVEDLVLLKNGVWAVVLQNPGQAATIIESAGMFQEVVTRRYKPNLAAATTVTPGEVLVRARAVKGAAYEWQYSPDGGVTWIAMGITTVANTGVSGLTVGGSYLFRFRTTVKKATGDWSPPLRFFVT
ncbi:MAG TPA: hypothetical protein VK762_27040 [Polyangiaceae bacterium]|nr:hypothetical protein [Polyangiaceae bacterium]